MTFETEVQPQQQAQPLYPTAAATGCADSFEMQQMPAAPYYIVQPTANGDSLVYFVPGNEVPAEALVYPVDATHHGECYEESVYSPRFAAEMAVRRTAAFFTFCALVQIFYCVFYAFLFENNQTILITTIVVFFSAILGWIGASTRSLTLITLHTFTSTFLTLFGLFTFLFLINIFGSIVHMLTMFTGLSLIARIRYHRSLPADLD